MRWQHWILLVFAILSAVGSLAAFQARSPWIESISSNLAAGFLGSFLTVLLIDRAIAKERDREKRQMRTLALGQLRRAALQQLELLCTWFRAAVSRPPEKEPADIPGLFSDVYYRELRYLDFSRPAPTVPPESWFRKSAMTIENFRTAVQSVLDKYAFVLDAETLEMLEAVGNANALGLIIATAKVPFQSLPGAEHRTYNVLAGEGVEDALRADVQTFLTFISALNECIPRPITVADLSLWRPNLGGAFGAARMTDEESARSNPMVMIGSGLPPVGGPLPPPPAE
jgi:hypothetical protein